MSGWPVLVTAAVSGLAAGSAWVSAARASRAARDTEAAVRLVLRLPGHDGAKLAEWLAPWFECPDCFVISRHPGDVANRFCSVCGTFPEDRARAADARAAEGQP